MATLSVLNFCSLGHAHSTPKWILDMTHISSSLIRSGKKEQSILNFSLFFLIKFMKIPQNFRKIPQNLMKKSQRFMKKVTKIHLSWFLPTSYQRRRNMGHSRIHFRVLWAWLGARKSKTDNVAINFPSLGSQRKRIYSFWPLELRAVQLSKKPLDI